MQPLLYLGVSTLTRPLIEEKSVQCIMDSGRALKNDAISRGTPTTAKTPAGTSLMAKFRAQRYGSVFTAIRMGQNFQTNV